MGNFTVIDIIFFILITLLLILGYLKGFVAALFSWATLILSMLAAVFFYTPGAAFIRTKTMEDVKFIPEILAFIAIFLIIMLALKLLERLLKDIIAGAHLGGINKFLGAVFGLIQGLAVTAIILFILSIQPLFDASKVIGDSIIAQILLPVIMTPVEKGKDIIDTAYLLLPGFRRFLA